jgi:hypothetical protein
MTTAVRRCSPGYGAPEQYARGTNPSTDVYGLGATFYALLTGTIPADALYRMTHLGSKNIDPLEPIEQLVPDVPRHVSDVIQKALAVNSKDRFATVEEFWQALNTQPAQPIPEARIVSNQHLASNAGLPSVEDMATAVMPTRNKAARKHRRAAIVLLFLSLALFALVAGLAFGNNLLATIHLPGRSMPVATATPIGHRAATATSQPRSTSAATSVATTYPTLAGAYRGSLSNQSTTPFVDTSMMLTNMKQSGAKISGYFSVGPALNGNGNFTGTVTQDKKIQFLVANYETNLPLFFSGTINTNGSMSGQYCSYQNGQCDTNGGGHGTWNVMPDMAGASSSLQPASSSDIHYI